MNSKTLYKTITFIHPSLAVFIPFIFIVCLDSILRDISGVFDYIPRFFFIVLFISVFAVIKMERFRRIRNKEYSWEIRFKLVILVLVSGIYYLMLNGKMEYILYPLIFTLVQYIFSINIYRRLLYREFLFKAIRGKSGEDLWETVFKNLNVEADVFKGLKYIKNRAVSFQVLIIMLMLFIMPFIQSVRIITMILLFIHIITGYVFIYAVNSYIIEEEMLGDKFLLNEKLKKARYQYSIILIIICLVLSIFIARNTSAFSFKVFESLWIWLIGLFTIKRNIEVTRDYVPYNFDPMQQYREALQNMSDNRRMIIDLRPIFEIAGKIILVLLILMLLYFIFKPLLNKDFFISIKGLRPFEKFKKRIRGLYFLVLKFFRDFIDTVKFVFSWNTGERTSSGRVFEYPFEKKSGKPGFQKRRQMKSVLDYFIRLIEWGRAKGIIFYISFMPGELLKLLDNFADEKDIIFIITTFEKSMFSEYVLETDTVSRYKDLIKIITSS